MHDTIAAIATAPGRAGIGVVRVSGPQSFHIAQQVCGLRPRVRRATLCTLRDAAGQAIDSGLGISFQAPHSYTGEDVFEFQGHGGVVVLNMVLDCIIAAGARRARAGEFTERAFLNGRMDLAQAEAVADLIDATSSKAARAAQRSIAGAFSKRVDELQSSLTALRIEVEAALDFPEEEIDFLADDRLQSRFEQLLTAVDSTLREAGRGRRLRDVVRVVIAGAPNAGKSSLMNCLAGIDRAIVTDVPGTTRDAIQEFITLDDTSIELWDTAGLRDSDDAVEREGIRRTKNAVAAADIVLLVVDATQCAETPVESVANALPTLGEQTRTLLVRNKIDLSGHTPGVQGQAISISAHTGAGLQALQSELAAAVNEVHGDGEYTARQRHLDALNAARQAIQAGHEVLTASADGELVAEELGRAQNELSMLTGRMTSDDLLGHIFASFCIGK